MIKWGRQCRWNEQCPVHRKPSINVAIIREHQSLTIWNDSDREGFYGQSLRNIWFNKNKEGYLLKDLPTQCSVFLQDLPNWFGHSTHFQEASRYTVNIFWTTSLRNVDVYKIIYHLVSKTISVLPTIQIFLYGSQPKVISFCKLT